MSVLGYPRIHFHGHFQTSPCTANNDYESLAVDTDLVQLNEPLQSMSDTDARAWMMSTYESGGQTWMRCGWNYFADYATHIDAEVSKVVPSAPPEAGDEDRLLGSSLKLLGAESTYPVIVDVDPRGIITTQLFAGGFQLGGGSLGLQAVHDTRAYTRWRNNTRNFWPPDTPLTWTAGAIMQFGFPNDSLTFQGTGGSPVLEQLRDEAAKGQGVQLQLCIFLIERQMSEKELHDKFQAERYLRNLVTASVTGTLGPWAEGELATDLNDRRLFPPRTPDLTQDGHSFTLGPVAARVQPDRPVLSLDLINSVPELVSAPGSTTPPKKVDLGPLAVSLNRPGAAPLPVGTIKPEQYAFDAYLKSGGIVDLPLEAGVYGQLGAGQLVIDVAGQTPQATPALSEPGFWVQTDDRAIYLDIGQRHKVTIQVRAQGGRVLDRPVTVHLHPYQYVNVNDDPKQPMPTDFELVPGGGDRLGYPAQLTVPSDKSEVTFAVEGKAPGPMLIAYTVDDEPAPEGPKARVFPWMTAAYTLFRVLPEDDYSAQEPTWDLLYKEVLRYYYVVFPAMSQIIPLNSEDAVKNAASAFVDRVDPAKWDTTLYMPITRNLSTGKRELLERWAKTVIPGGADTKANK